MGISIIGISFLAFLLQCFLFYRHGRISSRRGLTGYEIAPQRLAI
jgi:hypothetical protein